ncbi:MAG: glycoside hydrolase [Candidatus Marinimicrobia bacterium]|nr:glycoside hydrolase [Candidatus Neomarinimicrobiota bacterium]
MNIEEVGVKRARIQVTDSCVAAGDVTPTADSLFHTFPSLTRCSDGAFLCATLVGSEKSGPDGRIRLFRSADGCRNWSPVPSPTAADEAENPGWGYLVCHIAETEPGRLLAAYLRADRFDAAQPLFHPQTSGMQRTVVRLCDSEDNGRSWSAPRDLDYRLPDLIVPGRFVHLPDGALGMPFEVWHEWDNGWREGPSTRLARSSDLGRSWPEAGLIARDADRALIYGDPRVTELADGRLVALLWAYNIKTEKDLPVHRAESADSGRTWSGVQETGLAAQITSPVSLRRGLMLAVYQKRFGADAGLRALLSYDEGKSWDVQTDVPLWEMGHHTDANNPFSGYQEYAFGYSLVLRLGPEEAMVSFWVSNGKTTYVRLIRVTVEGQNDVE